MGQGRKPIFVEDLLSGTACQVSHTQGMDLTSILKRQKPQKCCFSSNGRMLISSESSMDSVTPNHLCVCFCITLPLQGINHEGSNQSKSNHDRKRGPDGKVSQMWFLDVGNEERVWDISQRWGKHGRMWRSLFGVQQGVSESIVGVTGRANSLNKASLGRKHRAVQTEDGCSPSIQSALDLGQRQKEQLR